MTLESWGGVTGSNFSIQGVNSTCNPMFGSVKNGFGPKQALSIFSHWLKMERSQNWPDLRSPISKLWDIHFIDTVACNICWKFQGDSSVGVALTNIKTFMGWGRLTWHGDLTLRDLGLKFSQYVRKRCMIRCAKNGGAARRCFLTIWKKNGRGGLNTPPQQGEG